MIRLLLTTAWLCCSCQIAQGQSGMGTSPQKQHIKIHDWRSLQDVLRVLESDYKVSFNFDDDLVNRVTLRQDFTWAQTEELESVLTRLLSEINLKFEKLNNVNYLILPTSIQPRAIQKAGISGIVSAKTPIHAADCYLKNNEHLGSITDSLGYFHFIFPPTVLYDTLIISAIGFERKEVPLSSIDRDQDTIHFYLDQQSIMLGEVLIESKRYDLKTFVLKAIASIPDNYPNRRHQLTGLYRKVSSKEAAYTHLEEAAVIIEDNGYQKPAQLTKIKTEHFRQTSDAGDIDSLFVAVHDKINRNISQRLSTSFNPLNKVYEGSSPIRHFKDEHTYFNFKSMRKNIDDYYTFELMDASVVNGDTIYQIAFAESATPPPPEHASGRTYLKINATDLAIVEAQFTRPGLMTQRQIKFEKKDGRYYPRFIRLTTPRSINKEFFDEEYDIFTFWFDEVKVKDFEKLKYPEVNDPADPSSHKRRQGTSFEFWDATGLIEKHPLEPEVKKDLEKRGPLEEQFRKNSQN